MRLGRFVIRRRKTARRRRRRAQLDAKHYGLHKESAREMVHARLTHWNQFYGHSFGRVAIRNQRSRWGSCSSKRNLNFNYRIAFLPEHLVDYIIVHELCHLEHFNHSKDFWDAMARSMPDFHIRKQELFAIPLHQIAHESLTGAN